MKEEEYFCRGKDVGTMGVVHGEEEGEEDEVEERLAHREGRRRLAGRAGLEKFFWLEEEEMGGSSSSCRGTNELRFRTIPLFCLQPNWHTQILNSLSPVPSDVFLVLEKMIGTFQTTCS